MPIPQAVRDSICEQLAEGKSLREICRQEGSPHRRDVFKELAADPLFADQYARAKEAGIEVMADELLDVADDGKNDWMERYNADGECIGWSVNGEAVQRSKLRIDARKWLLSKLAPKKYGDKIEHEHKGGVTVTLASGDEAL